MARSWHYPRWKKTALAVVMLLVLAGTLGLAELVVRHRRAAHETILAEPNATGHILLRPPARWVVTKPGPGELIAQEPFGNRPGRVLHVQQVPVDPEMTPEKFIESIRLNYPAYTDWNPGEGVSGIDPIRILGSAGILAGLRNAMVVNRGGEHETIWVAVTMLAPGKVLAMQLVCPDDQNAEEDKSLFLGVINGLKPSP